jgi:hypothetical protein
MSLPKWFVRWTARLLEEIGKTFHLNKVFVLDFRLRFLQTF